MAQRSHVPKFGNWEAEGNVPYTVYFDKARKGRTEGKVINPNDPEENPDILSDYVAAKASPSKMNAAPEKPISQGAVGRTHEHQRSKEDGDLKQFSDSPARHDHVNRRSSESAPRYGGRGVSSGETNKRPTKSIGSENSIEQSPLHHQARNGRGVKAPSPAWEGKGSYEGSHGTPGRARTRPSPIGDESPDKSAAVPKFGDWDENNPASADGYTHIFQKVREERQTARVPGGMQTESSHDYYRRQAANNDSAKSCCFPWGRK
ncbi:RPM1-interacting protein 4-like [Tripterygium wilfordii]|uniref:RPM1-interacting protein 4-like n=1 Tax=Tripterygium wilfordii TaxID=458696 RepID=UPI0018F7E7EC|nr:RPM1-interacting protein 4-like [Tripterygium wilfordii]